MLVDVSQGVEEYSRSTSSRACDVADQSVMQPGLFYSVPQQYWTTSEDRKALL